MAFLGFGKEKKSTESILAEQAARDQAYRDLQAVKAKRSSMSWSDIFNTQEQLDTGAIASTPGVFRDTTTSQSNIFGIKGNKTSALGSEYVGSLNKDTFAGSILGGTEAMSAYKKRKTEQKNLLAQGSGRTQSILGGSVI